MNYSPILVVAGEPNSIFFEIFFKSLKSKKIKRPIILISSKRIIEKQAKIFKFKKKLKLINYKNLSNYTLSNDSINLVDIDYIQKKTFEKISHKSKKFLNDCFKVAFEIIKKNKIKRFLNGPISKKYFLNKKYLGMTEFISDNFSKKDTCMLIYNKNLSVCPVTTHLPLKLVSKKINEKNIKKKIVLIQKFYDHYFKKIPKIAILGLNPHCESISKYNEDEKIIKPLVTKMNKIGYKLKGPLPADTAFLKNNRKKFDVIIGMYHDQVLGPIKTLFEYDAINITLGLPFLRVSPDHGPNERMLGKNISNPMSLIQSIKFLDKN